MSKVSWKHGRARQIDTTARARATGCSFLRNSNTLPILPFPGDWWKAVNYMGVVITLAKRVHATCPPFHVIITVVKVRKYIKIGCKSTASNLTNKSFQQLKI